MFNNFNLNSSDEEMFRYILNEYLDLTFIGLKERIKNLDKLLNYSHIIFRLEKKLSPPRSHFSAASKSEHLHRINLVDYVIFFVMGEPSVSYLREINNNKIEGRVKLLLADESAWIKNHEDIFKQFKQNWSL